MSRQKKELLLACEERDNHQLDKELLTNRLRHLEGEVEAGKSSHNEKAREIRILEVRGLQPRVRRVNHDYCCKTVLRFTQPYYLKTVTALLYVIILLHYV